MDADGFAWVSRDSPAQVENIDKSCEAYGAAFRAEEEQAPEELRRLRESQSRALIVIDNSQI